MTVEQISDEEFAMLKDDILQVMQHELHNWDLDPKLLRRLFRRRSLN